MRTTICLLAALLVTGCGGDEVGRELDRARERAERIRQDVQARIDRARDEFDDALLSGFDSGDPSVCRRYLPLS